MDFTEVPEDDSQSVAPVIRARGLAVTLVLHGNTRVGRRV
jgi:outer membrane PBP1 activator LpoA protein